MHRDPKAAASVTAEAGATGGREHTCAVEERGLLGMVEEMH